jgi:hypothetical protein
METVANHGLATIGQSTLQKLGHAFFQLNLNGLVQQLLGSPTDQL